MGLEIYPESIDNLMTTVLTAWKQTVINCIRLKVSKVVHQNALSSM